MKANTYLSSLCWLICWSLICASSLKAETTLTAEEAKNIAIEAYIYGYPLVTMEITRRVMTNVESPQNEKAPMGQFANARLYPDASFRTVTAPNADTLYSQAWLDLAKEPYILHVPNENNRYYLMPILSGWTNVFAVPGTRTTGTQAADFAITGPYWSGTLPEGVKEIKAPTNMIWILGRTYCSGTPEDYKIVHTIQDQYKLTPLSAWGKSYTPPSGAIDPKIDMTTSVRDQVNQMNIETFFNTLAFLLKNNPPSREDTDMVLKMSRLGIIAGEPFNLKDTERELSFELKNIPQLAQEKIEKHINSTGKLINGWILTTQTGLYGTDYLQRATTALIGLGANRPQDAIYPYARVDSQNERLTGKNRYVIHFEKDQVPPVKGFWSLTMYNDQFFFVDNPINRFTLSPRDPLKYNEDGSLDLLIQNTAPSKDEASNWLPSPPQDFILMLRLYWPDEAIIDGSWTPPVIKRVKS